MLNIHFLPLLEPTHELTEVFTRWENDPILIPLSRPNRNKDDLEQRHVVTIDGMAERLRDHHMYLIYLESQLIGEMSYCVDPEHLLKKESGTAWVSITIGEAYGRGRGIGYQSILYIEKQITLQDLARIELGVFEFNTPALTLYKKLGYKEFGRLNDFTYWQGRMWQDIRMEKYIRASLLPE